MTWLRPLVAAAAERLRDAGVESPEVDAELLLAHVLDVSRAGLAVADPPTDLQRGELDSLVARRASREPLQHLVGRAWFRYVELEVGPGVFVPRPETESMTGWVVDRVAGQDAPVVVDLCTGSGAIAAALASEVPHARVHAVELDEGALGYAVRNLRGTGVDLRAGDMSTAFPDLDGTADAVVANPPYIPLVAWESVAPEARDHDPALALWSGDDGLEAIRVVEEVAARLLRRGGVVACEHAEVQHRTTPAVFSATGRWTTVVDREDLGGRPRFTTATRT